MRYDLSIHRTHARGRSQCGETMLTTRTPTQTDLPRILELTRANRSLLADLEPKFWRKSANADELHAAFVAFQLANDALIKRILMRDERVIGYAVSNVHPAG